MARAGGGTIHIAIATITITLIAVIGINRLQPFAVCFFMDYGLLDNFMRCFGSSNENRHPSQTPSG